MKLNHCYCQMTPLLPLCIQSFHDSSLVLHLQCASAALLPDIMMYQ